MSGVGWSDSRIVGWGLSLALLLSVYPTIRLSAQCPDGSSPPCRVAARPAAPASNSVAVLYFDNLSRDTADAYLADGLTDEIITRLGQVERLTVKSGSAVRRFRGVATDDPAGLGRALGVAHLVTGSVRRIGRGLRVTVELVRAATGVHVWGEQYDRGDADVLAVEEAVSRAIVTGITGRLLPGERATLASRPTASTEAFDHFLRGNHFLAQRVVARAVAEYEIAARLDPHFADALARSALGYGLALDWDLYPGVPPDSVLARGEAAAERALQLNPRSSDAWMARGYLLSFRNPLSYEGGAEAFRQAIDLDPRSADAYQFRGTTLFELGDDSAAAEALHRALAIDPLRPITLTYLGRMEIMTHRYSAALRWLDSALTVDPGFALALGHRLRVRLLQGDTTRARGDAQVLAGMGVNDLGLTASALALLEARAGDTLAARARLDRELGTSAVGGLGYRRAGWLAMGLVAAGETERALGLLEGLRPSRRLWDVLRYPEFDAIRSNPRLQRLVEASRPR